jgi:beta-galactosidase
LGNIFRFNGSVNFYMFHGGTNFGFMNGANHIVVNNTLSTPFYAADVTSYGLNLSYYNHVES